MDNQQDAISSQRRRKKRNTVLPGRNLVEGVHNRLEPLQALNVPDYGRRSHHNLGLAKESGKQGTAGHQEQAEGHYGTQQKAGCYSGHAASPKTGSMNRTLAGFGFNLRHRALQAISFLPLFHLSSKPVRSKV